MLFFYVPFKMALELFYGQAGREEDGEEEQEEEEEYLPPIPTRNIQQTSGTGQEVPLMTESRLRKSLFEFKKGYSSFFWIHNTNSL